MTIERIYEFRGSEIVNFTLKCRKQRYYGPMTKSIC